MDWFNTQFYRDFGYGLCLPAAVPAPQAADGRRAQAAIEWGQQRVAGLVQDPER